MKWETGMRAKVVGKCKKFSGAWGFPPVGSIITLGQKHCTGGDDYDCFWTADYTAPLQDANGFVHTYALQLALAPVILTFDGEQNV